MLQHPVAHIVAVGVVDGLEAIHVHDHDGKRVAVGVRQLDLAAQHRGQEAPGKQSGQRIGTGFQLAHPLQQRSQHLADRRQPGADGHHRLRGRPGHIVGTGQAQLFIHFGHQRAHVVGLVALADDRDALVQEPQAELRLGQQPGGRLAAAGQGIEQVVFPVQQQGTLAFALGADVVGQREQPVGRVRTAGPVLGIGIGQGHAFQRQVQRGIDQRDRAVHLGRLFAGIRQPGQHRLAQHPDAAVDQVHRDADACVHQAYLQVGGDQLVHACDAGIKQVAQPFLQVGMQPPAHLVHRQEARRARIIQQGGVERIGEAGTVLAQPAGQCGGRRRGRFQAGAPAGCQARDGLGMGFGGNPGHGAAGGKVRIGYRRHSSCCRCHSRRNGNGPAQAGPSGIQHDATVSRTRRCLQHPPQHPVLSHQSVPQRRAHMADHHQHQQPGHW